MRRLLLTQSQVVVTVSSTAVIVFTFLLFLSGYLVQQRTITNLQATIRPRVPKPPHSPLTNPQLDREKLFPSRFFHGDGSIVRIKAVEDTAAYNVNWTRLAHIQLVRDHRDVCNAIMVLAELHTMRSPARRILLFPKSWTSEKQAHRGDIIDPFMDTSRRLLRLAFRRYGIELHPVSPIELAGKPKDDLRQYSLASAFGMTDLDRVLTIETPSLVLDAAILDSILAYTESAPFAMLNDTMNGDWVHSSDLMLLQPNAQAHTALIDALKVQRQDLDGKELISAFTDPMLLAAESEEAAVVRSIGQLHDVESPFNATAYTDRVAFLRFSDARMPSPQYEVPFDMRLAARPKNKDAEWTWTKLYGDFAQKRREICGLELETWHEE